MTAKLPPWNKPAPKPRKKASRLTAEWRKKAEARARKAGRRYPNLVDNMWAAVQQATAKQKTRAK